MKDSVDTREEYIEQQAAQQGEEEEVYLFKTSFGQRRFWFLDQFEPGSPYYNIPTALRIKGDFNVDVFRRVIDTIVERHEVLRTTFEAEDGEPLQVVSPTMKIEIPVIDLSGEETQKREDEIMRLATQEARKPFDLSRGPLMRVQVLKASDKEHVLLLTMHHIISDGWSMGVLVREISTLYAHFINDRENPLPELPIQYGDYAEWQNEYLHGDMLNDQLEWWKQQLGPNPPVLELPTDRPRPMVQTNVGSSIAINLPGNLIRKLKELGQQEQATLFMTMLSAFKVLLFRYAHQTDISIGTPIANRKQGETEALIGLFINTLVIRSRFDSYESFRQVLQRVRKFTLDAYEHQDLPFEYLVDALQPDRDMSYSPLFQVMFIMQNAPMQVERSESDIRIEMLDVDMGTSTFDLTLSLSENNEGMNAALEYNTDLFDRATVERLLNHYHNLLQAIVRAPETPVIYLPFLSQAEERRILIEWNDTLTKRAPNRCIHELVEARVSETPDAEAVVTRNDRITYELLNAEANQLAHYLREQGVGPDTVVGILHEKHIRLLVAVLGVLKAGAAYLPVDPDYPEERIRYMLEDAAAPVLVTQQNLKELVQDYRGKVIVLDRDRHHIDTKAKDNPNYPVDAENLAYLIYTSGSTGKSKGTMVRHDALVNAYLAWEDAYELRSRARNHLQMASFSFDVFSGDWTRALCSGGKLVLVEREMLLQAEQLYEYMRREDVNIAEFVPAVLRNLIQYLNETGQKLDFFRNLIAGSDIWYVNEYRNFLNYTGDNTRLINSFGLTEATIDSTYFESRTLDMPGDRLVPIGKPFANMTIYILDEAFQPVPVGARGELYVGGDGLARGYHNRPELTAERFLPNPFSKRAGDRMYRTGDMARYLPDGHIEFLGRADTQVKLRGFRIELGEIENALGEHHSVKQTAVILREDAPGDKRLAAYYVPAGEAEPTTSELRTFLSERLPDYMVPAAFVWLDEMPLTPNGKVDRKALPKPDQDTLIQDMEEAYIEPRTPTEEVVASVYAKVLNLDKVGARHNFFILGGHSLLATQLVSRLKDNFQIDLPLRHVFEDPTVEGLARAIDTLKQTDGKRKAPPIRPVNRDQELPLSFAQQRLWFLDRLEPNSPFYNIPESYRISGPLNLDALKRSFNEVIKRHETLRTTFHDQEGKPLQVIHDPFEVDLPLIDVSDRPMAEREEEIIRLVKEHSLQPIALDTLPLFRIQVIRAAPDDHAVILVMHHIISDNWSTQVLMGELAAVYNAFNRGDVSPLPVLPIQYADFAHWQRNWLQGEVLDEQIQYWENQLSDAPPVLELPTDRPRPPMQTYNGSYKTFRLDKELSDAVQNVAKTEGVTLFMTLLAAFKTLLSRYARQEDISIGTPIANRTRSEIERLIGFFVNTLVLRTDLSGNPSFRELLQRVREVALGAYAHQDIPFEKIVDVVQPERNMSHAPLFQVMFALQSGQATDIRPGHSDIAIRPLEAHSATAKFDITLFMLEEEDHLAGALEYNTDLFDEATIERLIAHFRVLLESVTGNVDTPIQNIELLNAREKQLLLDEWNGSEHALRWDANIVAMLEHQAKHHPEAIAADDGQTKLSYSELNRQANRLSHYLKYRNIRPHTLIGVYLKRSVDVVVALFAILKSGAAYVPIDPTYPKERLAYIIEDAGVAAILTEGSLAEHLPDNKSKAIHLDRERKKIAQEANMNPDVPIDDNQLAYMIYTSGSTGKPKGVMITHGGLKHYLNWALEAYPLEEGDGTVVHSTIAFDATVTAVFTPVLHAKPMRLVSEESGLEGLSEALRQKKPFSLVKITPAHLELLKEQIAAEEADELTKAFIIGGENLTADQIAFWQTQAPNTLLYNEYGPTETVVGCVVFEAHRWKGQGSVPIGRAIHNTKVYVLDEQLQPTPPGVAGELYISSPSVARGYHKQPDLTAERFLPDPFTSHEGRRMYKTGDLVRYQNDGQLIFLDRVDTQVKIRGYRIELGEIESILREHDQLDDAAVVVHSGGRQNPELVAYIVPAQADAPSHSDLRSYLSMRLPEYMVPAIFMDIEALPLTPNGKVDRKGLPEPERTRETSGAQYVEARTDAERQLTEIWQELLQIERIGVFDNFFALGGHSLLATQMMARIRDRFGVELPLRVLFEAPTVAGMVLKIEEGQAKRGKHKAPPLKPADRSETLPLSFAQQRLWFLDQLSPNNPNYNIPAAVRIHGALDAEALEKTLNAIISRHEVLRTVFKSTKGRPYQEILPELTIDLPVEDLTALKSEEREHKAREQIEQEARTPFELDRGPLLRARLIRIDAATHVFVINMHHIISDGWSTNVLFNEIGLLYDAFRNGRSSPLPELSLQYADYAAWQRSWLKDDVLDEQLRYWKEKIGVNPEPIDLPLDHARPAMQTFNGDTFTADLDPALAERLKQLSREHGATDFMVLLAAFQSLLYHYARQDVIRVGSPIANRTHSETEQLIGFFVNTLVLHADFGDDPTFIELLQQIKETTLGAYAHQDIPFEQLVDELQPERDMAHSPLFQVMFVFQNTPKGGNDVALPSIRLEVMDAESGTAKFDLTLMIVDTGDGFSAEFEYNTDLFNRDTIARMCDHFILLLGQITDQPNKRVTRYTLLDEAQYHRITDDWNRTQKDLPEPALITRLFEQQVGATPDATALVYNDQSLTFKTLDNRANQLAHYLRENGVGCETLVGISLHRSVEMVLALLAVIKAGGVYVPIDPAYPEERIRYIIDDAGIRLLLTQEALRGHFHEISACTLIVLDSDWPLIAHQPERSPAVDLDPENLAYMIYTSGSTGRPKGTMLRHRGLVNLTRHQISDFQLEAGDRALQFASFSFDASVSEIFTTLASGAALYLADREALLPGDDLVHLLQDKHISVVTLPPSVSALLKGVELPDLKTLVSAGESCSRDLAEYWSKGRRLLNAYGPTENTVCASSYVVDSVPDRAVMPIGKPIGNVRLYIVDEHLQLLPPGIPGELCIAGESLARGYHSRPDLTAEKFVPEPFSGTEGGRMYRSGDRARYLPDGNIEFLGRIDQQVKVRGYRIELEEIEALLLEDERIRDAVVNVHKDPQNQERLVGYYVSNENEEIEPSVLKTRLHKHLPDYMVPATFIRMDELPLTPNGKVDRRALPDPEFARDESLTAYVAARTPDESLLVDIWKEILQTDTIGVYDNFFELGGHSLLATSLISRVQETFQLDIALRALFENPTIAGLAHAIEEQRMRADGRQLPPLEKSDRRGAIPLSFAQQRLWFLDQLSPGSSHYNIPGALRMIGNLNVSALESAIREIIRRHDILRTTFSFDEGQPSQIIDPEVHFELPVTDLSDLEEKEREAEMRRQAAEEVQAPFDLELGPLMRVRLLKMHEQEHIIVFTMHHIISDGWSIGVLVKEVAALYDAFCRSLPSPLPELPIQYADYAIWQRSWLRDAILEQQLEFWRQTIGHNPPVLQLPTDRPRPPVQTFNGETLSTNISAQTAQGVKELAQQTGATTFMTLLAAFQTLLHRYSRQDEILVGSPIANRTNRKTEYLIGFFVNTLVFRADFDANISFEQLVKQVRENALSAYAHQDLPFEQLVEALQPERDMSHSPIFQVMFVMQNMPMEGRQVGDLEIRPLDAEDRIAKYDLSLIMMETDDGFSADFEFNTDLFNPETIERMQRHFSHLLQLLITHPDTPVDHLPLLPESERKRVLQQWNETEADFPEALCIHHRFEGTAEHFSDKTALVYHNEKLTYAELNHEANRLAHHLLQSGLRLETPVGIALERSPQLVIALLAVLKAGGVYIPVDPYYPEERIAYIIEDAGMEWLITQSALADRMKTSGVSNVILIDKPNLRKKLDSMPTENPSLGLHAGQLAYIIYTSGSTGRPKGTMLAHRGLVSLTQTLGKRYRVNEKSRSLQFASVSFDASVEEIFTALSNGAELHLVDRETLLSGTGLIQTLQNNRISNATLPPSVLNVLKEADLPHLQSVVSAGEACTPEIANHWSQNRHFVNGYGPTETTVCATTYKVDQVLNRSTVPIGRPTDNNRVFILDDNLNPVPVGVPGDLYIAGVGLARGYLNRPALTAERFIPNPFAQQEGERLYKTGDVARYLDDGNIEFLGRSDQQVKVRGYRIEPGEIESLLQEHETIQDSVVIAKPLPNGDNRLIAYIVWQPGKADSTEQIKMRLSEQLPDYMVPSAFVALEAIPLTPNGKVDRRALPEAMIMDDYETKERVSARTTTEARLSRIWEELLGVEQIGVTDNFFSLGGHSLLAMQLLTRIEQQFGKELPLMELFRQPTIEHIAQSLDAEDLRQSTALLVEMKKGREGIQPLFFVHPSGGSVHHYSELAHHLPKAQPFYGIQAKGLDNKDELQTSIEAMAATYVDLIVEKQPEGPYHIGSWSFGVIIAYEMAQQLRKMGKEVGLLILFDQSPFIEGKTYADDAEMLQDMFRRYFEVDLNHLRQLENDEQFKYVLKKAKKAKIVPRFVRLKEFKHYIMVNETQIQAWLNYAPKPYEGDLILFRSDENRHSGEEDLGWRNLVTGNIHYVDVPGDHISMLMNPEHAKITAKKLAALKKEYDQKQA